MSAALIDVLVWVLAPLVIGGVCLITRRDNVRAILLLSVVALALGGFDFVVFLLELIRIIPIVRPTPDYSFIDSLRAICYDVAFYAAIAALAFALYRTAQAGRLGWMTVLIVIAMVALVSMGIAGDPYVFFSRLDYNRGEAILFAAGGHSSALVTLIYALASRRDAAPTAPMPMIYPPVMYPPMMYPPMMYPPPAPYSPPLSYAPPPPPVVLPTPQPQPPTATPPS